MFSVSRSLGAGHAAALEGVLREVVETLAPIERAPCSPGEREAALWLAKRLGAVDGVEVTLEDEPSWGTFPPIATGLGLLGVAGAALVLRRRPAAGALAAALSFAGIVDEAQNGPRILRRLVRRRRTTVNVIARAGDAGDRRDVGTLVVLAHHDAPQTGVVFDQTLQRKIYERWPEFPERVKTAPPQWWIGLAGPFCTLAAAIGRRPGFARLALAIGALGSGLYGPTLFDAYRSFTPEPAALFALPVVRRPGRSVVTALGGGYLASGAADAARLPRPHLPRGLRLDRQEGAGEVQTPLLGAAADRLALADRVYLRHAKAGELCERFRSLHLLEGDEIVDEVPTYRSEGQCFL